MPAKQIYRPDVDGLRAIAVGAVVAFHAFPKFFPGGYVGVDIFFVISGYLITGIILAQLADEEFSTIKENAELKRGSSSGIRMKVSEKGAVSVYGMGRFPVTLYKEQWIKLLDMAEEIRAFIAANESQLKAKE